MISSKLLLLTALSCAVPSLAAQKVNILPKRNIHLFAHTILTTIVFQVILYSEEPCTGIAEAIEPNNKCTVVPATLYVNLGITYP